ncbi:MAG: IspD/TarI family cytidylyltransferase [Acidimicrobiia bacterium]
MEAWAIVVAAGSGARFGAAKQFELIPAPGTRAGVERIVDRSVRAAVAACSGVVVVVPAGFEWDGPTVDAVVEGGATRSISVRNGLRAVPESAELIAVHDAARPMASPALWRAVLDAVHGDVVGAIPGLAVADTIKRMADGRVVGTVERVDLVAVQTPQVFRADALRQVHAAGGDATDDAALIEADGGVIAVVPGEPTNVKVTHRADLLFVAAAIDSEGASS